MATKKPGRRKLARISVVKERPDVVLPRLQLSLLGEPVALGLGAFDMLPKYSRLSVAFEFPCPCCGKGITGEIVGRL